MRLATTGVVLGVLLAATVTRADTQATADVLTTSPGTVDSFVHTITLTNTGDTPISTFWYAWNNQDLNFLPSSPDAINMPDGWSATITQCSPNAYSNPTYGIEWYSATNPLAAGQSTSAFSFESNDSADDLAGSSQINYVPYTIGTSFVFMNAPDQGGDLPAGPDFQLLAGTAEPVPEPASIGLIALALAGPLLRRTRSSRIKRQPVPHSRASVMRN